MFTCPVPTTHSDGSIKPHTSQRGEKPVRVVVAQRPQTYYDDSGEEYIASGSEIVMEINVCRAHAEEPITVQPKPEDIFIVQGKDRATSFETGMMRAVSERRPVVMLEQRHGTGELRPIGGFTPQGDWYEWPTMGLTMPLMGLIADKYIDAMDTFNRRRPQRRQDISRFVGYQILALTVKGEE